MRYLAKLYHTEVDEFELVVLRNHNIQWTYVVIDELLVLCEFLDHVNCLQEDVEELLISVKQLLALTCLRHIVWSHRARRTLVVLINEIFESQLGVKDATVLPLFDSHIIQYLT